MLEMGQPSGTPVFVHLWLTSLSVWNSGISPKYTDWSESIFYELVNCMKMQYLFLQERSGGIVSGV